MAGLFGTIALTAVSPFALAKQRRRGRDDEREDADRALEAVRSGKAAPLSEIADEVQKQVPGRILEVEIEDEDGALVYEFKILSPQGQYLEVMVDARSKKILKIEEK